jgi:2-polyprenyl-6-methoxyphenol hydroxylase-like FAD-dependent oxidoreductase
VSDPVVVVGGGPAGAVAALVLARAGHEVTLLHAAVPAARAGETLPAAAGPLLRDLGLAEALRDQGHLPSAGNLSAWGSRTLSATDAITDPHGPGWQLDRPRFDALLLAAARQSGARVVPGAVLRGVEPLAGGWRVRLRAGGGPRSGGELRCAWLIDATGRGRGVARRCGAAVRRLDRLVAFQAHLPARAGATASGGDTRTLVEAEPDGWWYTSPTPCGGRMVAFLTDRDLARPAGWLSGEGFRRRLEGTEHVRRAIAAGPPARASARLSTLRPRGGDASSAWLEPAAAPGWTAVGDAALSFDPLSSQGLFHALYTGLAGARAASAALAGDADALPRYAARLGAVRAAYLGHRAAYYALESRWADQPFWRRRKATPHSSS